MTKQIAHPRHKRNTLSLTLATGILALSLVGCGGSDDNNNAGSDGNNGAPPTNSGAFSQSATWTVTDFSPETVSCYDFDTQKAGDCSGNKWDIKLENQARGIKLWSNSGDSGSGKGGVFGLIDWSDLGRYTNATQDPSSGRDILMHYNEDRSGGIFDAEPWFEYNLNSKHQLYPNNRVYLVTTDNTSEATASSVQQPIYAVQIINYYNSAGASGHPTIRWTNTALPTKTQTQVIDASNNDNWVYVDLQTGKSSTDKNSAWHIGFKRNDVILNGGDSGKGKVGGYLATTPAGYYNAQGELIASKFLTDGSAATLTDLTNSTAFAKPTNARGWVVDSKRSDLNPAYTGNFPNLDFGWYTYNGSTHQLNAKPMNQAQGALIRSAEGNSYARVRLNKINYPDATSTTPISWEFKIDIQPSS